MLDFFVGNIIRNSAQKYIDKLEPKINVHIPKELPLPSVGVIKKLAGIVSKINALESQIAGLSDEQLKEKTNEFKTKYEAAIEEKKEQLRQEKESFHKEYVRRTPLGRMAVGSDL